MDASEGSAALIRGVQSLVPSQPLFPQGAHWDQTLVVGSVQHMPTQLCQPLRRPWMLRDKTLSPKFHTNKHSGQLTRI